MSDGGNKSCPVQHYESSNTSEGTGNWYDVIIMVLGFKECLWVLLFLSWRESIRRNWKGTESWIANDVKAKGGVDPTKTVIFKSTV